MSHCLSLLGILLWLYYHSYLTDEGMEARKGTSLPKVTQLESKTLGLKTLCLQSQIQFILPAILPLSVPQLKKNYESKDPQDSRMIEVRASARLR